MQNRSMDFKIGFPQDLDYSILLNNIELSLNEFDSNYLLQEWGSGTKSLAVIAIHRAKAMLDSGSIVLGIEEPETNLHLQAQNALSCHYVNKGLIMKRKQFLQHIQRY